MQLPVTCKCPSCGTPITITKRDAARVLGAGRKEQSKAELSKNGKKGAIKRWGGSAPNKKI